MPFFPLPKYAHPDFSRPGVKPAGATVVDWDTLLPAGLVAVYYPNNGKISDLVTPGRVPTVSGGLTFGADGDGYHAVFDGSTYLEYPIPSVTSVPFTVINIFKTTDLAGFDVIWAAGDNGSEEYVTGPAANVAGDPFYTHARIGSAASAYGGTIISNKLMIGAGVLDTNDDIAVYLNGTNVASSANALQPTVTIERLGARAISGAPNKFSGKLYAVYVFDRALTANEVRQLSEDPYQILKPAVDIQVFWSAGGGTSYEVFATYSTSISATSGKASTELVTSAFTSSNSFTLGNNLVSLATSAFSSNNSFVLMNSANTLATVDNSITSSFMSTAGLTIEVDTAFTTSSDMGNGSIGNLYSLTDFSNILSSANIANSVGQGQAAYTTNHTLVADGSASVNSGVLFTAENSFVASTSLANIDVVAAMASSYAMTAANTASTQATASDNLLSTLQALSTSNSFAAISQSSISSFLSSGGIDLDSSCSFSITSTDTSISDITIEAIADYSVSLGLLCASVANIESSVDYSTLVSLVASNNSIINAQALYGIDNSFSVTRTMTTSAGAVVTVTSGFTTSGTQFTSTEVITPDSRMIRVLAENRVVQVLSENRYINVTN